MSHSGNLYILEKKTKNKKKTPNASCFKSILAKHVISLKNTTKHNCPQGKYSPFYYFRSLFSAVIMSLGLQFLASNEATI